MNHLNNGDAFPALRVPAIDGGTLSLPGDLAGSFGVVLTYRGAWCPFCVEQLQDFAAMHAELDAAGIKVVAFSIDDEATTAALAKRTGFSFPLGHDADADTVAAAIGTFTNPVPHYLQPSAFVLTPDGRVLVLVLSTGAVGRLTAAEAVRLVTFVKARRAELAAA